MSALLRSLPQLLAFAAGFLTAVFAEPFRQWLFRPKLTLSFGSSLDFITKTPETDGLAIHDALYIRIKVVNSRPRLAKACRAYLVRVEKRVAGAFVPTIYCDSIQLAWSARRPDEVYAALDLPRDVPQFVDVFSTRSTSKRFAPSICVLPLRYEGLFQETGVFRFHVQISGDGVEPVQRQITLHWEGNWEKFRVE